MHTTYLCRDKPAMKEALRAAGHPVCSIGRSPRNGSDIREFAAEVGFPVIVKPAAGAGASGTERVNSADELEAAIARSRVDHGAEVAVEEFVDGHEGFYDTISIDGRVVLDFATHYYPNVLEAMRTRWISPQFVTTNRIDGSGYRELRELGQRGDRRARHRHLGDPHGVVLRAQGPVLLRDRLPARRGEGVGPLRRRQRHRHLP